MFQEAGLATDPCSVPLLMAKVPLQQERSHRTQAPATVAGMPRSSSHPNMISNLAKLNALVQSSTAATGLPGSCLTGTGPCRLKKITQHVAVMKLICGYYVISRWLLCDCYSFLCGVNVVAFIIYVVDMWLLYGCYVVAMRLLCGCMRLLCGCYAVAMRLLCASMRLYVFMQLYVHPFL